MRPIDADAAILDARENYGGVHDAVLMEHFLNLQPTITPPPNAPLTLEQLLEMDGEPVWVESFVVGLNSHWGIVHGNYISDGKLQNEKGKCLLLIGDSGGYDIAWIAFRRKPEEGTA